MPRGVPSDDSIQKASQLRSTSEAEEMAAVNGELLKYMPVAMRGNMGVVLAAVKENWRCLQYATESLRGDPETVLEAAKVDGYALRYASLNLRADERFMAQVVAVAGFDALQWSNSTSKINEHGAAKENAPDWMLRGATEKCGWPGYCTGSGKKHECSHLNQGRAPFQPVPENFRAMDDWQKWNAQKLRFGSKFSRF